MKKKRGTADEKAPKSPWPDRLRRMKRFQDENSTTWKRNERLLFGKSDTTAEQREEENVVSYGWGLVEALKTHIFIQNPDCIVDAYDASQSEVARILSRVVPYDFEQMGALDLGNLAITDCFCYGYGAVLEAVDTEKADEETVKEQAYSLRRIHPKDILFDPSGQLLDLSDHRYIAMAWYPTIGDLRGSEDFDLPEDIENYPECSTVTRLEKKAGTSSAAYLRPGFSEEKDPDYKTICVWEVHDGVKGEVIYLTDQNYVEIGRLKSPVKLALGPRRLYPVTLLAFHPANNGFYPKAEIDLIANQLEHINDIEGMFHEDTTTKWRKYVFPADLIGEDQRANVTDTTQAVSLIPVDMDDLKTIAGMSPNREINLNNLVVPLQDVAPQRDYMLAIDHAKQSIAEIVGYAAGERGGLPQTRSAREAVAIVERQNLRVEKRAASILGFFYLMGAKHIQMLQQTMAVERYVRVFTDDIQNLAQWLKYKPEEISEGMFGFRVLPGTSQPQNLESKRASELQLFQTVSPILMQAQLSLLPAFKRLARFYQWEGIDELFQGGEQALAELAKTLVAMNVPGSGVRPEMLLEAASNAVMRGLGQQKLAMLKEQVMGGMNKLPSIPQVAAAAGQRGDTNPLGTSAGSM